MKRVLVITYYWPPSGGAGVQRWLKFVKYLRGTGWEPVVFCPENPEYPEIDNSLQKDVPPGITILRSPIWEPYDAYKKVLGMKKEEKISAGFLSEKKKNPWLEGISIWVRGNFFIPDARKFWIKPSVRYLKNYLKSHPVDAIISTGPPQSVHLIAGALKKRLHIPWLADFRDPWTNIDFYHELKLTGYADRKHRRLEKQVLREADVVTVISDTMAGDFHRIFPRKYDVITNGYDPEDITAAPDVKPDSKFSIAHIGTLGPARNPESLWKALAELVNENSIFAENLEIKLVGKVDVSVIDSLELHSLGKYLRRVAYMPHEEVVICQKQSRVLLLIINNTPNSAMILTGKFFEYMAAGRPILCIGPEKGDAAKILEETSTGYMSGFNDVSSLKSHIMNLFDDYRNGKSSLPSNATEKYSRKELTKRLAESLNQITGNSKMGSVE